jgi:hypothetical protein
MSFDPQDRDNLSTIPAVRAQSPMDGIHPDFVIEPTDLSDDSNWLHDRIHVVRRYYMWIVLFAVAAAGLVAARIKQAVPMYRANSTVRFNDTRGNLTSGVGTNLNGQTSWTVDPIKSQTELFSSRATAEAAVDAGNLQVRELTGPGSLGWLSAVDVTRKSTQDSLKLRFSENTVTAKLGPESSTEPYGSPLKIGSVSFIVAMRPPKDSAT